MSVLIFLDTETGGFNCQTDSLLSIGVIAYDDRADTILDAKEIYVWDDDLLKNPEALRVNGIKCADHAEKALSREAAALALMSFVRPEWRRAMMIGHNAPFDVGFIRALLGDDGFSVLFFNNALCTMQLVMWFKEAGILPKGITGLQKACAHFQINTGVAHTALADAKSTLELYRRMMRMLQSMRVGV